MSAPGPVPTPARRPTRPTYVYRLKITYPPNSDSPNWRPVLDPELMASLSLRRRWRVRRESRRPFRWPRERQYLSAAAAHRQAWYLAACGAKVEVQRSARVEWPSAPAQQLFPEYEITQNW